MGVAFTLGSSLLGVYSQNKALEAQGRANRETARSMIQSMNYNLQNLEQERRDIFEATVQELERTQMQGRRLSSSVNAAVNEGLSGGGRTASLLMRSSEADTNRAAQSVKDNYHKRSNEIDLNKEAALLNTKAQIRSIREVQKPSFLGTLVSLGTAYLGARQEQEKINLMRAQAGIGKDNKLAGSSSVGFVSQLLNQTAYQPFQFSNLLGPISPKQTKFTFDVPNPFSQDRQTINYF